MVKGANIQTRVRAVRPDGDRYATDLNDLMGSKASSPGRNLVVEGGSKHASSGKEKLANEQQGVQRSLFTKCWSRGRSGSGGIHTSSRNMQACCNELILIQAGSPG